MAGVKLLGTEFVLKLQLNCLHIYAAAMLCALTLTVSLSMPVDASEITGSSNELSSLAGIVHAAAGDRVVERTLPFAAFGYEDGVEVGALNAASRVEFDLPHDVIQGGQVYAYLQFDQNLSDGARGEVLILPSSGEAARMELLGQVSNQGLAASLPIQANGTTGFDFDYASDATCTVAQDRAPTFVIGAASTFTFSLNQSDVSAAQDSARTLGATVTITLPGQDLTPEQFQAAFILAQALEAQGRNVTFNRLPASAGSQLAISAAAIQSAMAHMLAGTNTGELAAALASGRSDASAAFTLLAAQGTETGVLALGDIVIATPGEIASFQAAFTDLRIASSRRSHELAQALNSATLELESDDDLAVLRSGPRAVLAVTTTEAAMSLAAMISRDTNTNNDLSVEALSAQADIATPGARSEWNLPFSFADLPAGTRPNSFDISLAPGAAGAREAASNAAGQLLHVFMNDQLLRTFRIGSEGAARRFSVGLPSDLMSLDNDLRVLVQRNATRDDCNENGSGVLAQLLPVSGIGLVRATSRPTEFFELAPYFRGGVDIALVATALASPVAALDGLRALTQNILPHDSTTYFHFVPEGMRFAPRGSFILYGVTPAGLDEAPVRFDRGAIDVKDRTGAQLLSLADMPQASVVQIIEARGFHGVWVNETLALNDDAAALVFDRGNLAIIDGQGVALWLNAGAPRGPLVDYVQQHRIADFIAANRLYVLVGIWALLSLMLLRVVLGARLRKSETKKAAMTAAKFEGRS